MRILFVCSESDVAYNFRRELISFLVNRGNQVDIICSDDIRKNELIKAGVSNFFSHKYVNRSKNPLQLLSLQSFIKNTIRETSPDCVLTFQAKPNIATGRIINKKSNIKLYSFIEGLGTITSSNTFKDKCLSFLIKRMYKPCFKKSKGIFVLNNHDKNFLIDSKLAKKEKIFIINGIGIDTSGYIPNNLPKAKRVLMMSRLVKEKGVLEYCEIAKIVRQTRKDIEFDLYGVESTLTAKDLDEYISKGIINYKGYSRDINSAINNSRIVALPSYYGEGLPRSLMEAAALKRVTIAYHNVGCDDVIENEKSGFLVDKFDKNSFAKKIIEIIDDNKRLDTMGEYSRKRCESLYESKIINQNILDVIGE